MIKKNYQLNRSEKFDGKAQQCFAFIKPKFKFAVIQIKDGFFSKTDQVQMLMFFAMKECRADKNRAYF